MRDWREAFFPASFRGVPFHVDRERPDFGRRLAVHDISGGGTDVEDTGLKLPIYDVSAYVASDLADLNGQALEAAAQMPGPGFLMLPMDFGLSVYCDSCRRNREKDRNGLIAYDLTFLRPTAGAVAELSAVPMLTGVVSAAAGAIVGAVASIF